VHIPAEYASFQTPRHAVLGGIHGADEQQSPIENPLFEMQGVDPTSIESRAPHCHIPNPKSLEGSGMVRAGRFEALLEI